MPLPSGPCGARAQHFLSAVFHFSGEFTYERGVVYRSFKFFILQATATTLEDFVVRILKCMLIQGGIRIGPVGKVGHKSWAEAVVRVVGYCWVGLWFCLTLPVYVDEASVAGFHKRDSGIITRFLFGTSRA